MVEIKEISVNDLIAVLVLGVVVSISLVLGLQDSSIVLALVTGIFGYIGIRNATESNDDEIKEEIQEIKNEIIEEVETEIELDSQLDSEDDFLLDAGNEQTKIME